MILLAHMLFGSAVASFIKMPVLAVVLAFLSHYLLDFIPHTEYDIKNIKEKNWHKIFPEILKIFFDFFGAILLILIFSSNQPIIYAGAIVSLIPDGFTLFGIIFPNKITLAHDNIHRKKIHFLKYKKISIFWRILSQTLITLISIVSLLIT